jgi:hypothetical protein
MHTLFELFKLVLSRENAKSNPLSEHDEAGESLRYIYIE